MNSSLRFNKTFQIFECQSYGDKWQNMFFEVGFHHEVTAQWHCVLPRYSLVHHWQEKKGPKLGGLAISREPLL